MLASGLLMAMAREEQRERMRKKRQPRGGPGCLLGMEMAWRRQRSGPASSPDLIIISQRLPFEHGWVRAASLPVLAMGD